MFTRNKMSVTGRAAAEIDESMLQAVVICFKRAVRVKAILGRCEETIVTRGYYVVMEKWSKCTYLWSYYNLDICLCPERNIQLLMAVLLMRCTY